MRIGIKPRKITTVTAEVEVTDADILKHGKDDIGKEVQQRLFAKLIDALRRLEVFTITQKPSKNGLTFSVTIKAVKEEGVAGSCRLN